MSLGNLFNKYLVGSYYALGICAECRDEQNKFPAVKDLTHSLVGAMNRKTILMQPESAVLES